MSKNIQFKIIARKINKIPEFTRFLPQNAWLLHNDNEIEARPRSNVWGWGQSFDADTETKSLRPRPKFWPQGLNTTAQNTEKQN